MLKEKNQTGFTLVEVVVSVAVFSLLAIIVFQVYLLIINEIRAYRDKATVASLANQYIETVRNLPYADIGTLGNQAICGKELGICNLPDLANPAVVDTDGVTYNVYYSISYVDDLADGQYPADANFNDYKQVKLYVANTATNTIKDFSTVVAPKGLESLGNRGGISIKVFDAVGQPIQGVTIHIENDSVIPVVDVTRTSASDGTWLEVLAPSVNGYHITVSKDTYSIDYTLPITVENQNPTKPDATVLVGEVTEVTFSIDKLSDLDFTAINQSCQIMAGVQFQVVGSKLIGTSPSIYKFDETYTSNASGVFSPVSNSCSNGKCLEWDSYNPIALGTSYMVYGSTPPPPVGLLPNTSQESSVMLGPKTNYSLLVIVRDSASGNPLESASVELQGPTSGGPLFTGGSVWSQDDWSGAEDSLNVSTAEVPYALRLAKFGSEYIDSGWLESSVFDTGSGETNYTTLNWDPSQVEGTQAKFQVATSNTNDVETVWSFIGPDGTNASYYETSGNTISSLNNNARYVRYKVFLSTDNPSSTPVVSNVSLNYVSGCHTPGQVMFAGLQFADQNTGYYQATVSKSGYQTQAVEEITIDGNNFLDVTLSP
ncbi:MAG: carboxypeptidase-like regulatory domain-containing protein [Candidatus Staskawiczbacteria bacterium]|nr:carboxypeptidase-like regulatory domain-containing protein [Candidatus Staskawiczbacteria bacterium]